MQWVILDRDGVINEDNDAYIKSADEWNPIEGSLQAISQLTKAGFHIAVITNQSGIARGLYDLSDLEAIHAKMQREVEHHGGKIDAIYYCPHGPEDGCDCRKPNTGLYRQFAQAFNVDLTSVPAVGDSLRDIQSAIAVGAEPILVETGKGLKTSKRLNNQDIQVFSNLYEAVQYILYSYR